MADTKISDLPAATVPLSGAELAPIVQAGATRRVPVQAIGSLIGVQRIDVKTRYNCFMDGGAHPLSARFASLSAAQIAFPNAGITALTQDYDTAAILQAEYDARTGVGGILGMPNGGIVRLDRQLFLQDCRKVAVHGNPNFAFTAAALGETPAIQLGWMARNTNPLKDVTVFAYDTEVFVAQDHARLEAIARGASDPQWADLIATEHGNFRPGSSAILLNGGQNFVIDGFAANGFDVPIKWGDNTYCVSFDRCIFSGGNYGASWEQTAGLNSGENIRFSDCIMGNNNYGVYWDFRNTEGGSQGGSVFLNNCSIDYNVMYQVCYQGANDPDCNNSLTINGGHFETRGVCSGTDLARIFASGILSMNGTMIYEDDAFHSPGVCTTLWFGQSSINDCILKHGGTWPLFWSPADNIGRVSGRGNMLSGGYDVPLYSTAWGWVSQAPSRLISPWQTADFTVSLGMQQQTILLASRAGGGTGAITFPNDDVLPHLRGTVIRFESIDPAQLWNIVGASGVSIFTDTGKAPSFGGNGSDPLGKSFRAVKSQASPNAWTIYGDLNAA